MPGSDGDKEERGRLLIVGGSRSVPGAAILAANAALRSGVGKLSVATEAPQTVALAIPEARVVPFDLTPRSAPKASAHASFDTVLIGPGMNPTLAMRRCVIAALKMGPSLALVLDAGALTRAVADSLRHREVASTPRCVLTPHAGEMAALLGISKTRVEADADAIALHVAKLLSSVVVLKGATTRIACDGSLWVHRGNNVALATSGSGDVLSGLIAALAARGASADQAAVWGVALHALAGRRLVQRYGALGALAREIPDEIPGLLRALSRPRRR